MSSPTPPETSGDPTLVDDENPFAGSSAAIPMSIVDPSSIPQKVDRFSLLDMLGAGGMGVVYAAYDPRLDRRVAVKLVRTRSPGGERDADRRRIVAEARAMARVSHPNVITVYDVGVHREGERAMVWIAMEFVAGRTVSKWIAEASPSWPRIVEVFAAAGRGLAAVHAAGLVHRDVKPDNVMIDEDGRVRVMDFGVARDLDKLPAISPTASAAATMIEQLTRTGAMPGTPAYMAPEQFDGSPADALSDQYAFCVALFEMLWGKRPFQGQSVAEIVLRMTSEEPPDPPRGRVPNRIRAAVRRGLSRDPALRWPTMDALLRELQPRRGRKRVAIAAAIGALGVAGVWMATPDAIVDPCTGAEAAFADAWDPTHDEALRSTFAATVVPFADAAAQDVSARLFAYRSAWIDEHRDACAATHVHHAQSELVLDRRMRCLDRRRRELVALRDALQDADATAVENASDAAVKLMSPERCGDPGVFDAIAEPPRDPAVGAAVEEMRTRLDEAMALDRIGRGPAALAIVHDLIEHRDDVPHPPIHAEVEVAAGTIMVGLDDIDAALTMLERGYFSSREHLLAYQAAKAALQISATLVTAKEEHQQGEHWLELARVEIAAHGFVDLADEHLGMRAELAHRRGQLDDALALAQEHLQARKAHCTDCEALGDAHKLLASVYASIGRSPDAIEHAQAALAQEERVHGPAHPHVAGALVRLADSLSLAERCPEAVPLLRRAIAIYEPIVPVDHPEMLIARTLLGDVLVAAGQHDEGAAEIEAALVIARASAPPEMFLMVLNRHSVAMETLGRLAEAEASHREVVEAMTRLHPEGHPALAQLINNLAVFVRDRGDDEGALENFHTAIAMRRATVEGPDPYLAGMFVNMAGSLVKLDRRAEAEAVLREAVAITEHGALEQIATTARFDLAKLVHPRDRGAARQLVLDARLRCDELDEGARMTARCGEIETWLAAYPP